ncbi:hypothetical protein VMCG_04068 [Cytospora schulzeri]|uniref:Uncharacterized protein n=1 Tax=Cytospora schulzeri TaxID=448051 RepID=A0A423WUF7_9PEZI|nr:hypothetical protein VMCG_04068 [Valsa malicola]
MAKPKKSRNNKRTKRPKGSNKDWKENMSGSGWKLLELIPMVDSVIIDRRPDIVGHLTAYSIAAAAVAEISWLGDQAELMTGSLKGIEENISSMNFGGDNFPGRVHGYVRSMIDKYLSSDTQHYFAVFNLSDQ